MLILIILSFATLVTCGKPVCDDNVFCGGELLHRVQISRIFSDSKTFVDMKIKFDRNLTLFKFNQLIEQYDQLNRSLIKEFVDEYFDPPGSEFENWDPEDWKENPKLLNKITDFEAKEWIKSLNELWKFLGRKMKNDVKENGDRYSIIYVPNPVIIPGGRFREFYYWDSYWIVKGLLHSEMYSTVKGMLSNFLSLVDKLGFVPNGGRIYYTMRSQPPLLILMIKDYLEATSDYDFLSDNIQLLEKEFQFWLDNRTVNIGNYTLARYAETSLGPRPESYYEDYKLADIKLNISDRNDFYSQIKSAAESGWDFSSRWFTRNGQLSQNLGDIKTKSIIPVDLNSILSMNAKILSEFYRRLNNHKKSDIYDQINVEWVKAMEDLLWDEQDGIWYDYNIENNCRRKHFFPSNLFPLWTNSYNKRPQLINRVIHYINRNKIIYEGGVPSSFQNTGQQWDFPNAWPPSQYAIIVGLQQTGNHCARKLAKNLALKWVRSNYEGFKQTRAMYEKYDATVVGGYGGGGEYHVQLGFGWTNGIVMDLLFRYPDLMTAQDTNLDCMSKSIPDSSADVSPHIYIVIITLLNILYMFISQ